jgi:hypothetical protein
VEFFCRNNASSACNAFVNISYTDEKKQKGKKAGGVPSGRQLPRIYDVLGSILSTVENFINF